MTMFEPVPMPSEEERIQSINAILNASASPRQRCKSSLAAAGGLPFSMLFFGMGDCLFLAAVFALGCIIPACAAAAEQLAVLPLLFLLSPALFAALQLLTTWKEEMSGTLEWKQTCKLSFASLTALRMLVFGGAATLLCVPQCALLWYAGGREISLLWMLSVSFASLFLYAALSLALGRRRAWPMAGAPAAWLCMGAVLLCWNKAALFLLQVPVFVFVFLCAGALAAIWLQIKNAILHPVERGSLYAVR